jgi:hypothetical protein
MEWIFWGFLLASICHMIEEYAYPGGFADTVKRVNPRVAPFITVPFAVVINGLQILLCVFSIIVGRQALTYSLLIAGQVLVNGAMHLGGTVVTRHYLPGVVTGLALYVPLSLWTFVSFINSGEISLAEGIQSLVLGGLLNIVPMVWLGFSWVLMREADRGQTRTR